MAGVLGIALSGPRSYAGFRTDDSFVNETGKRSLTRDDIDRAFEKYISPVIDARQRLSDRFGATKYSVIIGHFAAGERNLARSWSALTDGRADVAREALKKSRNAFEEALREVS